MVRRMTQTIAGAAALWLAGAGAAQDSPAPDPAERAYLSANGLLNRGMYELAADEYGKFLAGAPGHEKAPVARYGLAVCLVRLRDFDGAAGELERLRDVKGFQFAAEVGLLTAQCDMARGRYAEAAEAAESTVKGHAQSAVADDAAGILAEARYRTGDFSRAREAADLMARSWGDSPARPRAELIWGLSAVAMGDDQGAAERLAALAEAAPESEVAGQALLVSGQARHRLGDLDSARSLYERVIARPKGDLTAEALVGLGTLLHAEGDLAGAGRTLDRVGKEFGSSASAPAALMERGRVWLDAGDVGRAQACFAAGAKSDAIAGDESAFWLARCELREGDAGAAAARLGRAIEEYPESTLAAELRFDRAAALVRAGDDGAASEAIGEFERAFPEHALMPEALEMHAGAEHRLGRYAESRALCGRFLGAYGSHERAPEVLFLGAENDLLNGELEAAADGYARVIGAEPSADLGARSAFRLGTVLYRMGRAEEAEPLLVRVTSGRKTAPEFRAALLCLGDSQFQTGRWAEAERTLGDYLAVASDSADDALLKLGLCAARQDRPADAVARFDELVSRFPESSLAGHAQFEKGQALVALDRPAEARAAFEGTLKRDPEGPLAGAAESQLGSLALASGDGEAGAAHFARAAAAAQDPVAAGEAEFQRGQALLGAGSYEEAAGVFERVVSGFAGHARHKAAAAQRVVALRRAGQAAEALAAFERLDRAGGAAIDEAMRAGVLYERARALQELGRKEEAADGYREVIDTGASGLAVYAMVDLAALESDAGREAEAGVLLAQAAEASRGGGLPDDVREQTAYRLAASQFRQGRHAEAAKTLDPLIDGAKPGDLLAPALRLRAQARMAMGRPVQAGADFGRLSREFSEDAAAAEDLLGLGEALAAAQDWPASGAALSAYLDRFPTGELWFRARFGAGWARENQGRHEEAMSDYGAVIAGHEGPTAARAQFQTGECLFALKRYDEAATELLKVDILYAYPEWSAAALFEAGRCFAQMNKPGEAESQFSAVTEKYASTDWAKLAAKELARLRATAAGPGR